MRLDIELAKGIGTGQKFESTALFVSNLSSIVLPDEDVENMHESKIEHVAELLERLTFRNNEKILLSPFPVVNVMLIKQTDDEIARRVNVG
jgi:hypothetical protein